ncbi:MAG: AAA family ATPase [Bacteroidetes bacterium]|nr:AAA family ATPase [Bacteroidota bacterium]
MTTIGSLVQEGVKSEHRYGQYYISSPQQVKVRSTGRPLSWKTPTEDANAMIWGNKEAGFRQGLVLLEDLQEAIQRLLGSMLPSLAAHVSMFGENVAFQEALLWLKDLHNSKQDGKEIEGRLLDLFIAFVNQTQLLPHDTRIKEITNEGVFFEDGNGVLVHISNLSDGFRWMLSLMFELLRQLLRVYQMDVLFANADQELFSIDLPGVVLIDEVDAHLHPTWQTRIGEWFTKYFPNIQFIVTTHSPLICRAAENGTIWRLPAPGSDEKPQEVTGLDRKRLIYGDILDAYGTELFGEDISVSQSEETKRLHERMLKLQRMSMDGLTSDDEETELDELRSFL